MPPYIAFWGPFSAGAIACQRQLGVNGQRCTEAALQLSMRCTQSPQAQECSDEALATAKAAMMARAGRAVRAVCSDSEAQEMRFRDLSEAETDMMLACSGESETMHALMAPASHPALPALCESEIAAVGVVFVRTALRDKRATLDRIAVRDLLPSQRLALINVTAHRLARVRELLAARLTDHCPDFAAATGSSPSTWLVNLELRSECVIFAGYIQSAYTCPR